MRHLNHQMVVIVGGAGPIGSALCRRLNRHSFSSILIVDDLGGGDKWRNLVGCQFEELIPLDELLPWLQRRGQETRVIVYLLGDSVECSDPWVVDTTYFFRKEYHLAKEVVRFSIQHNVDFLFKSCVGTYGHTPSPHPDKDQLNSLKPETPLAFAQHLLTLWIQQENAWEQVTGLKCSNVFGPADLYKKGGASAVSQLATTIREYRSVSLPERDITADWIHLEDVAEAIELCLLHQVKGLHHVSRGTAHSLEELAQELFNNLEVPYQVEYQSMPLFPRPVALNGSLFPSERLSQLGWTPKSICAGLQSYFA